MKKQYLKIPVKIRTYFFVGVGAFLVEYISFLALISLFDSLLLSQSISFCAGLMVSFAGNRNITFKHGGSDKFALSRNSQLLRYTLLAILNLLLTNVLIHLLVDFANITPIIAKAVVMSTVITWNYLIFNRVIFRTK